MLVARVCVARRTFLQRKHSNIVFTSTFTIISGASMDERRPPAHVPRGRKVAGPPPRVLSPRWCRSQQSQKTKKTKRCLHQIRSKTQNGVVVDKLSIAWNWQLKPQIAGSKNLDWVQLGLSPIPVEKRALDRAYGIAVSYFVILSRVALCFPDKTTSRDYLHASEPTIPLRIHTANIAGRTGGSLARVTL